MPKSWNEIREKNTERIIFTRKELPGFAAELEQMYNAAALNGAEPSERMQRLILWVQQEESVMQDPKYDPEYRCPTCGL